MTTTSAQPTLITENRIHRFDITDADPTRPYPGGPSFLPTQLVITWNGVTGSEWQRRVRLVGARLKKDGTPGKAETSRTYYRDDNLPAWIVEVVASTTPDGAPR